MFFNISCKEWLTTDFETQINLKADVPTIIQLTVLVKRLTAPVQMEEARRPNAPSFFFANLNFLKATEPPSLTQLLCAIKLPEDYRNR